MTNSKTLTPKSYLFSLSIIHAGLTFGILLFTIVIFVMSDGLILGFKAGENVFIYLVPIVAIIAYFGSNYLFNKQLASILKSNSLMERLMLYQKASVIRFAILEGAAFLSTIAFMLHKNIFYLVISVLLILYLFKLRPTKKKVMDHLSLSLEEQQYFQIENGGPE
ncbi:hypothetical protein DHD32_09495 [Arenibacter sp. TNZ]|jgi:hypothetical protein|uniref:hypothetical protein n=1 Tax=Arenibacter TaxID=178469 RepID=UPI000CD41E15|nr:MULTISPECIES: hypothetical protein [Arenibacter]MCM4171715.1 hypothetical protein [Arenibacter sp. TNZ]